MLRYPTTQRDAGIARPRIVTPTTGGPRFSYGMSPGDAARLIEVNEQTPRPWQLTVEPEKSPLGLPGFSQGGVGDLGNRDFDGCRAFARVQWGTRAPGASVFHTADIDIRRGWTLPLFASTVLVDIMMPATIAPGGSSIPARVPPSVKATCVRTNGGHAPAPRSLVREVVVGDLAPNSINFAPIPAYAYDYVYGFGGEYFGQVVIETMAASGDTSVALYDRWYQSTSALTMTNQPRWQPRPLLNDGGYLRIVSLESVVTLTGFRMLFFLAL